MKWYVVKLWRGGRPRARLTRFLHVDNFYKWEPPHINENVAAFGTEEEARKSVIWSVPDLRAGCSKPRFMTEDEFQCRLIEAELREER